MSQLAERRFESQQISFTQWLVLIRLRFHDHMSATRLSEEMGHDMGALTRVVDSLERAGLVTKQRIGRRRVVRTNLETLLGARRLLDQYEDLWRSRIDRMNDLITDASSASNTVQTMEDNT